MEDFETHLPCVQSSSTDFAMELLAQLRPSGRILDHFQVTLDGSAAISQEPDLGQLIPSSVFKGYKLAFQYWLRDIRIRRNMMSSAWMDVPALVCANEAQVLDPHGAGVAAGSFMRMMDDLPEDGPNPAPSDGPSSSARTEACDCSCRACPVTPSACQANLPQKGKPVQKYLSILDIRNTSLGNGQFLNPGVERDSKIGS
jgi:hypothetical protein